MATPRSSSRSGRSTSTSCRSGFASACPRPACPPAPKPWADRRARENNLLAAAQEIEKLKLLAEGNQIDAATVQAAVADSARFDVFGLIDAALGGEAAHALRILEGLRGEGIEPPVILWGLAREIRLLAGLSQQYGQGIPLEKAFAQARPPVWDKRRPLLTRALQRHSSSRWNQMLRDAQLIDAQIKGRAPGSPWSGLSLLALSLAGQRLGLPAA